MTPPLVTMGHESWPISHFLLLFEYKKRCLWNFCLADHMNMYVLLFIPEEYTLV